MAIKKKEKKKSLRISFLNLFTDLQWTSFIEIAVHLHNNGNILSANHGQVKGQELHVKHQNKEKHCDLSEFNHGTDTGARQTGLTIKESAELLEFSHTMVSRAYTEWH